MEVNAINNASSAQTISAPKQQPIAPPKSSTPKSGGNSDFPSSSGNSINAVSTGMTPKNLVTDANKISGSNNSESSKSGNPEKEQGIVDIATIGEVRVKESREEVDSSMQKAIAEANEKLSSLNKEFQYSVHDGTNTIMIKMIDSETDEVIKEFPEESRLDAIAKVKEMIGVVVDERK